MKLHGLITLSRRTTRRLGPTSMLWIFKDIFTAKQQNSLRADLFLERYNLKLFHGETTWHPPSTSYSFFFRCDGGQNRT